MVMKRESYLTFSASMARLKVSSGPALSIGADS